MTTDGPSLPQRDELRALIRQRLDDLNVGGWIVVPHPNTGEPMQEQVPLDYIADALVDDLAARRDDLAEKVALCSQCGERPSCMVKVGTADGWCEVCLNDAADTASRDVLMTREEVADAVLALPQVAELRDLADRIASDRDEAELETMQAKAETAEWVSAYDTELVRRKAAEATVRITEEQAVKVELVARALGFSTSDLIRTAIAEYLALALLDDEGIRG